ncbi:hypothetical protein HOV93_09590 [Planctomycetes bacterium FF15]|uniref:Uncharacterized protein n=1 Tax=Bremerella alba TaxID=980252 RepID=A0A7V9A622_9BACT|nr:hypothetical protein [Bremerella alba]
MLRLLLLVAVFCGFSTVARAENPPNFTLILIDDK